MTNLDDVAWALLKYLNYSKNHEYRSFLRFMKTKFFHAQRKPIFESSHLDMHRTFCRFKYVWNGFYFHIKATVAEVLFAQQRTTVNVKFSKMRILSPADCMFVFIQLDFAAVFDLPLCSIFCVYISAKVCKLQLQPKESKV